jgi:hypothetical protein
MGENDKFMDGVRLVLNNNRYDADLNVSVFEVIFINLKFFNFLLVSTFIKIFLKLIYL